MYPVPRSDTAAAPDGDRHADAGPVFLDRSGRRQRRVRRLGWLLVVPAAGYAVLLLSALLGGPTVSGTYVPLPEGGGHRAPAHPGTATSGTQPRHPRSGPTGGGATTAPRSASATAAPPKASASPTAAPSTSSTATAKPVPTPTASHGNSQVTTHPVPTHTGRGRG